MLLSFSPSLNGIFEIITGPVVECIAPDNCVAEGEAVEITCRRPFDISVISEVNVRTQPTNPVQAIGGCGDYQAYFYFQTH